MKLHLPVLLRKALLACFAFTFACSASSSAAELTLGSEDSLSIDYAAANPIPDLEGGILQLNGDTILLLSNCGVGDGKIYTLATGISELMDAEGNAITLDSSNNAISNYFDKNVPGTGFWADGTLQLVNGSLLLVLHGENVITSAAPDGVTHITTRQTSGADYQYYKGLTFSGMEYSSSGVCGGMFFVDIDSPMMLSNNGSVVFEGNTASASSSYYSSSDVYALGGAIYGCDDITLNNNGCVVFEGNTAEASSSSSSLARGGAICENFYNPITLSNNNSVVFEGNTANSYSSNASPDATSLGGAIYGYGDITLSCNGSMVFEGNSAISSSSSSALGLAYGGAIYGHAVITLSNNGSVTFNRNNASSTASHGGAYGGAIYNFLGCVILSNNGGVTFIENTACSYSSPTYAVSGGAICCGYKIEMNYNNSVTFSGNSSTVVGVHYSSSVGVAQAGAIRGAYVSFRNNGTVSFSGNKVRYVAYSSLEYTGGDTIVFENSGGAISVSQSVELCNNENVIFSDNIAGIGDNYAGEGIAITSRGGAIDGVLIDLTANDFLSFQRNKAGSVASSLSRIAYVGESQGFGGAIYGENISVTNNGIVEFVDNIAITTSSTGSDSKALGGAIYGTGDLDIRNNNSVLFERNAEVTDGEYRLRSIYVAGGNDAEVSLSAAAGKSIMFRDSIYIGYDSTVCLNANYTDAEGNEHKQQGDIIFTGATTEDDLYSVKGNVAGTEKEILDSRTTEVNAIINLYDGRLIVRDGALIEANGINVLRSAGGGFASTLWLDNGRLSNSEANTCELSIAGGSALEISGCSKMSNCTIAFAAGSKLTFNVTSENASSAALTLDSSTLTLGGTLTLTLNGDAGVVQGQSYKLLTGLSRPGAWDESRVIVESGLFGWEVDYSDLVWEGDTLWLNYDGNALPPVAFNPNLDRNQQEVYDTVKDIMGSGNPGGVLGQLGQNIIGTRDEAELKRALDEISGREYATIMSSQMEGNLGHLRRLRASAGKGTPLGEYVTFGCSYPSNKGVDKSDNKGASIQLAPSPVIDSRCIRAGVTAFHEQAELDADSNGEGFERSETGAQLTMEYLVSNDFVLGMGLSHSRTKLTPTYGKRRDEDNTHFDLYGVYRSGRWSSTTSVGIGLHQHELGRTVAGMQTQAEADGLSVNFMQELAYSVYVDEEQGLQVFGAVESSFNQVDAFSETGAGNASLCVEEQDAWVADVTLGLRYNHTLPSLGNAPAGMFSVQGGVVTSLGDTEPEATLRFAGAPGYSYKQYAAERSRWGYSVGASVNLPVSAETAVFGTVDAVMRNNSYTLDAQVGLKMAF